MSDTTIAADGDNKDKIFATESCDPSSVDRTLAPSPTDNANAPTIEAHTSLETVLLKKGDVVGRFRVERALGQGGMGTVYEAVQLGLDRRVALKVPRGLDSSKLSRFDWEAKILASLQHPGIAALYDHGEAVCNGQTCHYFAMELASGQTLQNHWGARQGTASECVDLFIQIAAAVAHAQQKGIVHRDLKPDNIMVSEDGKTKVLDFGVARLTAGRGNLQTQAGQVIGTFAYMSPEQARGDVKSTDASSDVYSLGVMLFQLLTGQLPVEVRNLDAITALRAIAEQSPARLGAVRPELAGDLELILEKSLRKDPAQRYGTVAEWKADLERWRRNEPINARPLTLGYQLMKLTQRHRTIVAAASLVLAALVFSLVFVSVSWRRESRAVAVAKETNQILDRRNEELLVTHWQLAHTQFVQKNLSNARTVLENIEGFARQLYEEQPTTSRRFLLANTLGDLALLSHKTQKESADLFAEVERHATVLLEDEPGNHTYRMLLLSTLANRSLALAMKNGPEAVRNDTRGIELCETWLRQADVGREQRDQFRVLLLRLYGNLGDALWRQDDLNGEIEARQTSLRRAQEMLQANNGTSGFSQMLKQQLAYVLSVQGLRLSKAFHHRQDEATAIEVAQQTFKAISDAENAEAQNPHQQLIAAFCISLIRNAHPQDNRQQRAKLAERVMKCLNRAKQTSHFQDTYESTRLVRTHPVFEPMRDVPAFQELIKSLETIAVPSEDADTENTKAP